MFINNKLFSNKIVKTTLWLCVSLFVYFIFLATLSGEILSYEPGNTYSKTSENGSLVEYKENGQILTSSEKLKYEIVTNTLLVLFAGVIIFATWKFSRQIFTKRLHAGILTIAIVLLYIILAGYVDFGLWLILG
jgi:hypothetical protein